jgi:hypothetical protein
MTTMPSVAATILFGARMARATAKETATTTQRPMGDGRGEIQQSASRWGGGDGGRSRGDDDDDGRRGAARQQQTTVRNAGDLGIMVRQRQRMTPSPTTNQRMTIPGRAIVAQRGRSIPSTG